MCRIKTTARKLTDLSLVAVIAFIFLTSCNMNAGYFNNFQFDFHNLINENCDTVVFDKEINDSLSYTLNIITRLSYHGNDSILPLNVIFESPSGGRYSENIKLQINFGQINEYVKNHPDDKRIALSKCSKYYDIMREYRTGICPEEKGKWKISVILPQNREKLLGLGLSSKNEQQE